MVNQQINLFTTYYKAKTQERQKELDDALISNIENKSIQSITVFLEGDIELPLEKTRCKIIKVNKPPTYQTWVDYSNKLSLGSITILANTDIHFDSDIKKIRNILKNNNTFMALSRYEYESENNLTKHPNPHWSQDVWGYVVGSTFTKTLYDSMNVSLGVPRCDNKVAYLFAINGWKLINPVDHLVSIHRHNTQFRTYDKKGDCRIIGGVAYVHPNINIEDPAEVEFAIWGHGTTTIKKVLLNKKIDDWSKEQEMLIENVQIQSCGELIYSFKDRFYIYQQDNKLIGFDSILSKQPIFTIPCDVNDNSIYDENKKLIKPLSKKILQYFFTPCFNLLPLSFSTTPKNKQDYYFWQYPNLTELEASKLHQNIDIGNNIDDNTRVINAYLSIPWSTIIDKMVFPTDVILQLKERIETLVMFAKHNKYDLKIHTVCQHLRWRKALEYIYQLKVTDLHISHFEKNINIKREVNYNIRLHPWQIYAVNFEDTQRNSYLKNIPITQRTYLCSFIGAHMHHYKSAIRLQLMHTLASTSQCNDIKFCLRDIWHLNKIVYKQQVQSKEITQEESDIITLEINEYNETLSQSIFSLCPEGAGINTIRLWESLAIGSIPVVITDELEPGVLSVQPELAKCIILINTNQLPNLIDQLRSIDDNTRRKLSTKCKSIYRNIKTKTCF